MSGIFGTFSPAGTDAAELAYLALFSLQHRGEQSCGIVVSDGERMRVHTGVGLVANVLEEPVLSRLPGRIALGHVRSTHARSPHAANALPLYSFSHHGAMGIAHDGHLTNAHALREELLGAGMLFQTTNESELVAHLLSAVRDAPMEEAFFQAAARLEGAFAVAVVTDRALFGLRDPLGIRPLSIGRKGERWFLASETCAFDAIGARLVRDVAPGEMVAIDQDGLRSYRFAPSPKSALCLFEFIYFARSDSVIGGRSVHEARKEFGRRLALEARIDADLVVPAPDSALSAAIGYAESAKIPFDIALAKNRYVGRTFGRPTPELREKGVRLKLNAIAPTVAGRRVILVDDSIVRGTTSGRVIKMLREAGATEVHMAVASPPLTHPCPYGIHVPTPEELIAARRSPEEIRRLIDADSLHYLSAAALYEALGMDGSSLCAACFGGGYPIPRGHESERFAEPLEERPGVAHEATLQ